MAGLWTLTPSIVVRLHVPEPFDSLTLAQGKLLRSCKEVIEFIIYEKITSRRVLSNQRESKDSPYTFDSLCSLRTSFMPFCVYILKCQNGSLYTGLTSNLSRRINDHLSGNGSQYTKDAEAQNLVYHEIYNSKPEAAKREKQLKGWSRAKKLALISNNKTELKRMAISRQSPRCVPPR